MKNNKIGVFVIIVTLLSLAQLLFFTYTSREITECQSSVNQAFLDTLKVRAKISDGDRDNIKTLVSDLAANENSEKALNDYYARDRRLEALRNSFQYPDIEGTCG